MAHQLNIRNPTNTSWTNLLEAKYHDVEDVLNIFTTNTVEDVLSELYITKTMKIEGIANPNSGDYQYPIGTIWTNTTNAISYICTDNTVSFAVWKQITTSETTEGISDVVGEMVTNNTELGIDVTYENINHKLNFTVDSPTITLTGAVNGSGVLQNLSDLTINTIGNFYTKTESEAKFFDKSGDTVTGMIKIDGSLNMGTSFINDISNGPVYTSKDDTLLTEKAIRDLTVDSYWLNSVISKSYSEPYVSGAPSASHPDMIPSPPIEGDRYIVKEPGSGDWENYDKSVVEWTGTEWLHLPLHEADTTYIEDEKRYYMYNNSYEWVNILQDTNIEISDEFNYFTYDYLDDVLNELYIMTGGPSGSKPTGLEKINEGIFNIGWRLIDRNPDYYGDIGMDAVDLSTSTISGNYGATGEGSISTGYQTISSGSYTYAGGIGTISKGYGSTSFGKYNTGTSFSTIFEIGMGSSNTNRKNAFEVYTDGILLAPELDINDIDNADDKVLVTKEYIDNLTYNANILVNPTLIIGANPGSLTVGSMAAKRWEVTNDGSLSVNIVNSKVDPTLTLYNALVLKQVSESISEYWDIDAPVVVSVTSGNIWVNGHNVLYGTPWITTATHLGLGIISIGSTTNTSTFKGLKIEYGNKLTPYVGPWMDYETEMLKANVVYP